MLKMFPWGRVPAKAHQVLPLLRPLWEPSLFHQSAGERVLVCAWGPLGAEVLTWDGVASGGGLALGLPLERTTRLPGGTSASLTEGSAGTCCCFLHSGSPAGWRRDRGRVGGGRREEGPWQVRRHPLAGLEGSGDSHLGAQERCSQALHLTTWNCLLLVRLPHVWIGHCLWKALWLRSRKRKEGGSSRLLF